MSKPLGYISVCSGIEAASIAWEPLGEANWQDVGEGMNEATVTNSDCLEWLRTLPDNSADAIVCDPPAGISFMSSTWDSDKGGRKQWITWLAEVMAEALRVAKPGAHALVWALPRTSHWTGTALEDAGWEPSGVITHIFASGFPKSVNVSKHIDAKLGAVREVVGKQTRSEVRPMSPDQSQGVDYRFTGNADVTAAATTEAKHHDGYGSALKPSSEHWHWVRKPLTAVPVASIIRELDGLVEDFLWLIAPVKLVESLSASNSAGGSETPSTAQWLAVMCNFNKLSSNQEKTDTFKSQEMAKTFWNIARLWQNISVAHLISENTSTTRTALEATTELKTLRLLISATMGAYTLAEGSKSVGQRPFASSAIESLIDKKMSSPHTPILSATESALWLLASTVESILASVAEQFSMDTNPSVENTVPASAIKSDANYPACSEHWWLVRKPLDGTIAGNVLKHGTGAINVDGCRVAMSEQDADTINNMGGFGVGGKPVKEYDASFRQGIQAQAQAQAHAAGRWPPNTVFSHAEGCEPDGRCADDCAVAELDRQSGDSAASQPRLNSNSGRKAVSETSHNARQPNLTDSLATYGDSGGASRYFPCFKFQAKASVAETELGCEDLQPRQVDESRDEDAPGANNPRNRGGGQRKNFHPTKKSVDLMRWLCRLVAPPPNFKTGEAPLILDPFTGSGSTGVACVLEGFRFAGSELDPAFVAIARARIAAAQANRLVTQDGKTVVSSVHRAQMELL